MPKRYFVDQGTPEWHHLRLGIPTASQFHRIITPAGKPSAQANQYRNQLIAERLLLEPTESRVDHIQWVERGKFEEPHAASQFEFVTGLELEPIGFITNDEKSLGCSPDRLVVGRNEAVEIKCPQAGTHIGYLLDGLTDYRAQVQGQMLVGGFDRVHFYSWHKRMPPKRIITERDEEYIALMAKELARFVEELDTKTEEARAMGDFQAREWIMAVDPERAAEYLQ